MSQFRSVMYKLRSAVSLSLYLRFEAELKAVTVHKCMYFNSEGIRNRTCTL